MSRGVTQYNRGDYRAALADETKAIELEPAKGRLYFHRGLTHRALGDRAAAERDFTRAVELGDKDAQRELERAR
jgi:Flp pilus assembly protein TadD